MTESADQIRQARCPQCGATPGGLCRDASSGFWLRVRWVHPSRIEHYKRYAPRQAE